MQTNTVEEATLTQDTNEHEPQPDIAAPASTPQPETLEPEITALIPTTTEQDVIEGKVIVIEPPETPEDHMPPKQKPYWLLIPFTILCCLVFLAASLLLPLFTPTATVTILPIERSITTTTAIQVHGRQVAPLTLAQSATVPATGKRHQAATRASGTITFYNGLLTSQPIAAGTVLTSSDDVRIVTDQPTTIPAANPPIEGQVTVSAHALNTGASGNIPAYDINQACCATSVLAKNTEAFTGGAAARDVIIVTKHDLEAATGATNTILLKSEQAALHAQVGAGEALIPPSCTPSTTADHRPGEEAKQVTVTVSETCTSIAYVAHDVDQDATSLITSQATTKLGANYSLIGDIQVHIIRATITNQARGIATLAATLDATYIYRLSPGEKGHLVKLIAGKTPQQAHAILSQAQGIAAAVITINGNTATLPDGPEKITIVIAEKV